MYCKRQIHYNERPVERVHKNKGKRMAEISVCFEMLSRLPCFERLVDNLQSTTAALSFYPNTMSIQ